MKKISMMIFCVAAGYSIMVANADTVIGSRCYFIEPPNAPQDNAWEKMWVIERSRTPEENRVFDSKGIHFDSNGVNTSMHATSELTIASDGTAVFTRFAFGVLGAIDEETEHAKRGDAEAISDMESSIAIFTSQSTLHAINGRLEGTFVAQVWHHDFDHVELYSGTNESPGIIIGVPCSQIGEIKEIVYEQDRFHPYR